MKRRRTKQPAQAVGRRSGGVEPLERRLLMADVHVQDVLLAEGPGQTAVFTVQLDPGDVPASLDYATVPGTALADADYTPVSGTLKFDPSPDVRTQTVAVPVSDDAFWEDTEWFYLEFSNGIEATLPGEADTYRATATVRDNDPRPTLSVSDARVTEGDVGDAEAVFTVSLSAAQDRPVSVEYATAGQTATSGIDFAPAAGALTFEPGETSKQVSVLVHGDNADESNETFVLNLRAPTVATLQRAQGFGTIVEDDDEPPTADVINVSPDPRTAPVDSVRIGFGEPVTGLDVSDFMLTRDGATVSLDNGQTLTTSDDGRNWTLEGLGDVTRAAGQYVLTLSAATSGVSDLSGNALAGDASDSWRTFATVTGRHIFYNGSSFDDNDTGANPSDDLAVAPDKTALLPGQSASFANVTSYSRGLNGIMVDVAGLQADSVPTAADFVLKSGRGGDSTAWPDAPAPASISVRPGPSGTDRVTLIWPDLALQDEWLRVTVLATARTGLAAPDVFIFGNLVGETGDGGAEAMSVTFRDWYTTRRGVTPQGAPLTSVADHNRDGRVNSLDVALVRANISARLTPPADTALAAAVSSATDVTRDLLAEIRGRASSLLDARRNLGQAITADVRGTGVA